MNQAPWPQPKKSKQNTREWGARNCDQEASERERERTRVSDRETAREETEREREEGEEGVIWGRK